MPTLKLTLIENALESFEHAINHINTLGKSPCARALKRPILDLAHVAELLFKERLSRVHPAFILTKVDEYPSVRAHTVSPENALNRLKRFGIVRFEEDDEDALKTIREKRNEIEHFEFNIDVQAARVLIGGILSFIFRFARDHLGLDWASRRHSNPEWRKLADYDEFYQKEKVAVIQRLEAKGVDTTECRMCGNETFDLEEESCGLCGHGEPWFTCRSCGRGFFHFQGGERDDNFCPECWDQDGYAQANCEKY